MLHINLYIHSFRHLDCLGILVTDVCELGLKSGYEGRRINGSLETEEVMVRMDAFVQFIEGMLCYIVQKHVGNIKNLQIFCSIDQRINQ